MDNSKRHRLKSVFGANVAAVRVVPPLSRPKSGEKDKPADGGTFAAKRDLMLDRDFPATDWPFPKSPC